MNRIAAVLLGGLTAVLLVACGVSSEDDPSPITEPVSSDTGPTPSVINSPDVPTSTTPTTPTTTTTRVGTTVHRPPPHSTEPSLTR